MTDRIDLNAIEDLEPEPMPEGDALGCYFSASSYSTSSCPGGNSRLCGHGLHAGLIPPSCGGRVVRALPARRMGRTLWSSV